MTTADLPVAIVGAGGIARTHAAAIATQPGARIVAVCDPDPARAAALAAGHPGCRVLADLDAVLDGEAVLVHLCTPPHLHAAGAAAALRAGRHAVLEKPLAGSLDELDALIELEAASGRRAIPVLQNRLGDGPRALRALRAAGIGGRFLHATVDTCWRRTADYYAVPWRGRHATELGGPLLGLAVHALDVVMGFAPPLTGVAAHAATLVHPIEVEDTAAALFAVAGGGWISCTVSVHAQREYTRGTLCFEGLQVDFGDDPYAYAERPWRFCAADPAAQARIDAIVAGLPADPPPAGVPQLWHRAARVWAGIARGEAAPEFALASGRPSLEAISAAYAAAASGARVPLPLPAGHPQRRRVAP